MLAMMVLLFFAAILFVRTKKYLGEDVFHPLSMWYIFIIVFVFQRLITITIFQENYRFLINILRDSVELGVVYVAFLGALATLGLELAFIRTSVQVSRKSYRLRIPKTIIISLYILGLLALFLYFQMLGGIGALTSTFGESKSVSGGGPVIALSSLAILGPLLFIDRYSHNKKVFNLVIGGLMLGFLSLGFALYGRAGNIVWCFFVCGVFYHYRIRRIKMREVIVGVPAIFYCLLIFKTARLLLSWQGGVGGADEFWVFFDETVFNSLVLQGGESSMIDLSIAVLVTGRDHFPLGSFFVSWFKWIIDILPSAIFGITIEEPTVGRQIAWWYRGGSHINSGLPILGYVTAAITGTVGLTLVCYFLVGLMLRKLYRAILNGRNSTLLLFSSALWFLLFFTRVGDFTAATVAVVVLVLIPYTALVTMETIGRRNK